MIHVLGGLNWGLMESKDATNLITNAVVELTTIRQQLGLPLGPIEFEQYSCHLSEKDLNHAAENLDVIAPRHFTSQIMILGPLIVRIKSLIMNSLILRVLRRSLSRQWALNQYIYRTLEEVIYLNKRLQAVETQTKKLLVENQKLTLANTEMQNRLQTLIDAADD